MGTYIVRRLLISIPVFFGITMLVFMFVALAPGDAASAYTKPEFRRTRPRSPRSASASASTSRSPSGTSAGSRTRPRVSSGYRIVGGQPIAAEVGRTLQASLLLTGTALILGILVGIPLGVLSARASTRSSTSS